MIHDPTVRSAIEARLKALRSDAPRQWGTMTPDQMLWHLNQFLEFSLGQGSSERQRTRTTRMLMPIMHFLLLYMPWPKGARTHPDARAKDRYDFEAERQRSLRLIEQFVSRPLDEPWPVDPVWGEVSGSFASKIQAKHFDHHLRQFGT